MLKRPRGFRLNSLSVLLAVPAIFLLSSCSPDKAPASATEIIDASADSITGLFQRECLEQRSIGWAREKARAANSGCGSLFDCEYAEFGDLASWTVNTSSGSTINVTLWWPLGSPEGPVDVDKPPDRVTCQLQAPAELGAALKAAAERAASAEGLSPLLKYSKEGSSETWTWSSADGSSTAPQIELYFDPELATRDGTAKNLRPWDLRLAVFKHGPFIW